MTAAAWRGLPSRSPTSFAPMGRRGAQETHLAPRAQAHVRDDHPASKLDEGVHGKPRDAPKSAARKEPRLRPLRRRPTPGRWCKLPPSRRDPLHPAPRRRSRWPRRPGSSTATTVSRSASAAIASFFPFQTTYYLNGHSFIEQELTRAQIGFRKNDNAFLAVDDVAALQAAADRLSADIIRQRLDYWTFLLGPKFSARERKAINLSRFYAIAQIEYCRNFIFKRHFPIHKLFERSCELGLWRLTGDKIAAIFGTRVNRRMHGKLAT